MNQLKDLIAHSINGTMKFPQIVGTLLNDGFESYHVDIVRNENRYYKPCGESYVLTYDLKHTKPKIDFSAKDVEAAVRKAQEGKITYPEFMNEIAAAGCNYYVTYLIGKKVSYFGRNGESHTEHFPKK